MVFIISSFGPTWAYQNQEMMKLSLTAFLTSLDRQTDKNFLLFISCHDIPDLEIARLPFIRWCSMTVPNEIRKTRVMKIIPNCFEDVPFSSPLEDMSRKTINSMQMVYLYARENEIKSYWVLRMDSDDLLAKDHIQYLNNLDTRITRAVYNRICHMIDPINKQIAIHRYPYSTTCNAIYFDQEGPKDIFYLCRDHTQFMRDVRKDNIPYQERDFALCILTNTGNSISGRPELNKERFVEIIPSTKENIGEIRERYGFNLT